MFHVARKGAGDSPMLTPFAAGAAMATVALLMLVAIGCGDGDSLPEIVTATPPDTPALNIQFFGAAGLSDENRTSLADLVALIQMGIVQIETGGSTGSGFIINADGLVMTNEHVVGSAQSVNVWLTNGRRYSGNVLERDATADLALVQIDSTERFDPIEIGDPSSVRVGDEVLALGFPLADTIGNSLTVTRGIISSTRQTAGVDLWQTDAAINPGNSGGPLVGSDGRVIGVNTSRIEETDSGRPVQSIGFAVSASEFERRLDALRGSRAIGRSTPPLTLTPTVTSTPGPSVHTEAALTPTPRPTPTPTSTPTATPTATPTPTPVPPEYTEGMGYAHAENLKEPSVAHNYASAFAKARLSGLSSPDARVYASGLMFYSAEITDDQENREAFFAEYESAHEEALRDRQGGFGVISQAISTVLSQRALWPFTDGSTDADGTFATSYARGLAQTPMRGLAAHGYALTYAGHTYTGSTNDEAEERANIYATGFELSESALNPIVYDLKDRFIYARAYERGYAEALHRSEEGVTRESAIHNWASVYAQSYVGTYTYDGSDAHACIGPGSGLTDLNFAYERRRYNPVNIPAQDWSTLDLAHTCASLLAHGAIDLGMTHNPELHASAYYQGARHVRELTLSGQEADDYAFNYYLAYYQKRGGRNRDFVEVAHIYAVAYADVKRVGLPEEESVAYAGAYLEAFLAARQNGSTDEEAHVYASAFAMVETEWPQGASPP